MRSNRWVLCAGILVATALLAACSAGSESDPTATDQPTATVVAQATATQVPSESATTSAATELATVTLAPTSPPDPVALESLSLSFEPVVSGFNQPVVMAFPNDGTNRFFIAEQEGTIYLVEDGAIQATPFLDIFELVGADAREQGLLGLVFHPNYAENGYFYVNYTDNNGDTVISRFQVSDDPFFADPGSQMILLQIEQPATNHNGGWLAFGPDGYLYAGTGDGGGAGDRFENAQNGTTLLGAMLRIDVDNGSPYSIPADNPYAGHPDIRNEFWAVGLRNPWRFSFDQDTGDLYIADVGQAMLEEINFQPAASAGGENYGWPFSEGTSCFREGECDDTTGLTMPVAEYPHTQGCSVTGGYVYRGELSPALQGMYIYGDFCSGHIWGLRRMLDGSWQNVMLVESSGLTISSFAEDENGELYVLDFGDGAAFRIVAS